MEINSDNVVNSIKWYFSDIWCVYSYFVVSYKQLQREIVSFWVDLVVYSTRYNKDFTMMPVTMAAWCSKTVYQDKSNAITNMLIIIKDCHTRVHCNPGTEINSIICLYQRILQYSKRHELVSTLIGYFFGNLQA